MGKARQALSRVSPRARPIGARGHIPVRRRAARGQALVEFALAVPVLALVLMAAIEFGFLINAHIILEDTVRQAAHYGAMAGRLDGPHSSRAPGCLADYAVLSDIQDRLSGTSIDPAHVRAVFLYAANTDNGSDMPRTAADAGNQTYLAATSGVGAVDPSGYPNANAYLGDYYYATYDPATGANVDPGAAGAGTGSGAGAIYRLFHGPVASIFNPGVDPAYFLLVPPTPADTPVCGSALLPGTYSDASGSHSCLSYPDLAATGTLAAACLPTGGAGDPNQGNWPPRWRNNESNKIVDANSPANSTPWPDSYGMQITYDYSFHTPLFQLLGGVFLGSSHLLRLTDQAAFMLGPTS
jgi:hypothetical protein